MRAWAVVACAVTATVTACGVPGDGAPRALSPDRVPFDLLQPNVPTTVPSLRGATAQVVIFLLRGGLLQARPREVEAPPSLQGVLDALATGPTQEEGSAGDRTAIVGGPLSAAVDGSLATVDLSDSFNDLRGSDLVAALAQIVFTATAVPGVDAVAFSLGGSRVKAPVEDGSLIDRPLRRSDYHILFPS